MEDKWYLVTGANNGIGYAVAKCLIKKQCHIISVDISQDKISALINENDSKSISFVHDLNNLEEIENIFIELEKRKVKLSGFVHCAGLSPLMTIQDLNIDTLLKTFNVNYFSFMVFMKYFENEKYSLDGSRVIGISSIAVDRKGYRQSVYASSKAALENSIQYMSKALLNRKILINGLALSAVNTDMFQLLCEQSVNLYETTLEKHPLGLIEIQHLANYIVDMLLLDQFQYTTGTIIEINGGNI